MAASAVSEAFADWLVRLAVLHNSVAMQQAAVSRVRQQDRVPTDRRVNTVSGHLTGTPRT